MRKYKVKENNIKKLELFLKKIEDGKRKDKRTNSESSDTRNK